MRYITVVDVWGGCGARERCLGLRYRGMRRNTNNSGTGREIAALLDQLVATCTPVLRRTTSLESPLCHTGPYIPPSLGIKSKPPSRTRTIQVSARTPLELWCSIQLRCDARRIRATQGMPKRKKINRQPLSCTFTRTHLEGRRSVELRNFPFQPFLREPRGGISGALWRLPFGTDVTPHIIVYFQICNRLLELMKKGDAKIFSLYYSLIKGSLSLCGRPGSSEVPRNPLTRWDVSSIPPNGIFLTKKLKNKI